MRSGVVFGAVAMVDGVVARIKEELDPDPVVVATGGLAALVCRHSLQIDDHAPLLTLEGLRIIHERNAARPARGAAPPAEAVAPPAAAAGAA